MKKFLVEISGEHEAEIGQEILTGIYEAVQKHGYADVSVKAETIKEKSELYMPDFLKNCQRGRVECDMRGIGG